MLTLLSERPGEINRFRLNPWQFQQTFKTPLKDLNRFVTTFLAPFSLQKGAISTDEVVFEPKNLLQLLANNSLSVRDQYHLTIQAEGQGAIADLLQAALGDWVDFVFVPSPEVLAIYADHDEYATFYTRDDATLKNVVQGLEKSGFEVVLDYTRGSSGAKWRQIANYAQNPFRPGQ
jgi:hypothetical protein